MEDHLSWSLDVGRSLVVSSDLDHSYLETLNIPGAIRAFGLNTVASINLSAGIIGLRGRPGRRKTEGYVSQCLSESRLSTSLCRRQLGKLARTGESQADPSQARC